MEEETEAFYAEGVAIRSYITTATRNGQNMLDALTQAADGHPRIHAT